MPGQHARTHVIGREARADMVSVVDSIRSIIQTLRVSGRESEQSVGLSSAQLYVLNELNDRPAMSINELAERTFTHQSSVSMVVARLVEGKLVTRAAARGDARRLAITLTPAGRALLRKSPDPVQARLVNALRSMSRGELKELAGGLDMLTGILSDQGGEKKATSPKPGLSLKA